MSAEDLTDQVPAWKRVPERWEPAPAEVVDHATVRALEALSRGGRWPVVKRLLDYYDPDGDYAGASFAELAPVTPNDITAADLHATRLLSVPLGPGATRRLLSDGPPRSEVLAALRRVPDGDLLVAAPSTLVAMEVLYLAVKTNLSAATVKSPDAWVTASKLCARKRPNLFPVRDNIVRDYLDLTRHKNYQVDWQVYRALIGDHDIIKAVDEAIDEAITGAHQAAGRRRLWLDTSRLRVLDAALWTYARRGDSDATRP